MVLRTLKEERNPTKVCSIDLKEEDRLTKVWVGTEGMGEDQGTRQ